ncbi:MAG: ATP-binding protein [Archangium sp.]|nr:ATP-binding protein [Archangium sp.]
MSRLAQALTIIGCIVGVLVAATVQHVLVLGATLGPERFVVPFVVGLTFGSLIVALVKARAAQRLSLESLATNRREIASLNERLSHTVRSQGNELKTAERRLVEADRLGAVGLLAGGIAHDFNNLLTVVLSGSAFLLEGATETQKEVLEGMLSAGERGATLTRQLLTLSQPPRASSEARCINRSVAELESLIRRLLGTSVRLEVTRCEGPLTVRLGRSFVEQVLVNLVVNARDAMPGGGTLSVTTERKDGTAVLRVRDTGAGISPEVQSRIFEPFFTTKGDGRGTGLGLAVVMDAMQRAGGQISVDSRPGEGTLFVLTFPLADRDEAESTPPSPSSPSGPDVIVFVDAEASLRTVMGSALEQLGYEVKTCSGQAEALTVLEGLLQRGQAVALITDLLLADGDGHTLVHEAKARTPLLPAIVTSSFGLAELKLADDAVPLAKPYTPARLVEAIDQSVRQAHRETPGS